jgi:hypothetical protein
MGILNWLRTGLRVSKHQTHVRKNKRLRGKRVAVAIVNPAGTKLAKYFKKAVHRGPRGY